MIPLLYQLSYTGTNEDDSVKTHGCPDRPTSSWLKDVQGPPTVLGALQELLIPKSCSLCPNPPKTDSSDPPTGLIPLCQHCREDFQFSKEECPRCLHRGGMATRDCCACQGRVLERPLIHLGEHSGTLQRWVLSAKNGGRLDLAISLGRALARKLKSSALLVEADNSPSAVTPIVTYVPRSFFRFLVKGQPLARILGERIAAESGLPIRKILKQRYTTGQSGKTSIQRKSMRLDQFQVPKRSRFEVRNQTKNRRVILIDDVLTTGTTLRVATRALEQADYKVIAWVSASVSSAKA
ncbi:MAG: hypothetical protein CBC13_07250 [Planctomycetia bacterium TMED53]|nr:MAG: hypothetical protein CBC13_07250 [Planctomycetia bacterium TMED53]